MQFSTKVSKYKIYNNKTYTLTQSVLPYLTYYRLLVNHEVKLRYIFNKYRNSTRKTDQF